MGDHTFTSTAYRSAVKEHTVSGKSATFRGEQQVRETGKLNPLVDPAEYGVIRPSRIRLEERPTGGLFEVTVGAPVPTEYRLDTTGSMGDNVERALRVLPQICGLSSAVLPDRDPFFCASIFGDIVDRFPLCRGQFEVLADRMVNQLTLMHPEGKGGDSPEDPHYGLFGAAYLTRAYLQLIGLKSYDYTITDAPARDELSLKQLQRIFGDEVIQKAKDNGHQINARDLPSTRDVVRDLLKRAHAFVLIVDRGSDTDAFAFWRGLFGKERIVVVPKIEFVPHIMATITGLTEGELDLKSAIGFLTSNNLKKPEAISVVDAVAGIPLGAQRALPNFKRLPKKGDLFNTKDDLWPISAEEASAAGKKTKPTKPAEATGSGGWI